MHSFNGHLAFWAIPLFLCSGALSAAESCSEMDGTYTGSAYKYTVECDTSLNNPIIYDTYYLGDTFKQCIMRCDIDSICSAALFEQLSGNCYLAADFTSTSPSNSYDVIIKGSPVSELPPSSSSDSVVESTSAIASSSLESPIVTATTEPFNTITTTSEATTSSQASITSDESITETSTIGTLVIVTTSQGTESIPSTTGSLVTTTETSAPIPSSTAIRNLEHIGAYDYKGCLGSSKGYPAFTKVATNSEMTTEKCVDLATGSKYIGIYEQSCYKADSLSETEFVSDERCNLPCPGDSTLICGGIMTSMRRRRCSIPSNRLLTLYTLSDSSSSPSSSTVPEPPVQS